MLLHNSLCSLLLVVAAPLVGAVYRDEVGEIDFHHQLVGVPQPDTTFFHKPRSGDPASLIYTLSDVGVIGAVNPDTGAVVWRQQVSKPRRGGITGPDLGPDPNSGPGRGGGRGFLRAGDGESWLAAAHGSAAHAWHASTGRNIWWTDFEGIVRDLEIMELTERGGQKDVLLLSEERAEGGAAAAVAVVRRLDGATGAVRWEYREALARGTAPLQVSTDVAKVFLIAATGHGIRVSVLDTLTGRITDELTIGAHGDVIGPDDVMFVGVNSAAPVVGWTDRSLTKLKINVLGSGAVQEFPLSDHAVGVAIYAPHLVQSETHFLVHTRTRTGNRAEVYHIDPRDRKITKAYDLPHLPGPGAFSVSSEGSNVYFTRITQEEVLLTASSSHGVIARWPLRQGQQQQQQQQHHHQQQQQQQQQHHEHRAIEMEPYHAASEVFKREDGSFATRCAITTRADDWVLVKAGQVEWTRPEGLTGAVAAAWAEIPASEDMVRVLEQEAHINPLAAYGHRVRRHLDDLQHLPHYLSHLPRRILGSILGADLGRETHEGGGGDHPARDAFGFHKLVVLATCRGSLYGLDTGNQGRIVWSTRVFEQPDGHEWAVKGMFVEDSRSLVTVRGAGGESVVVRVATGEVVETTPPGSGPKIQSTAIVDSDLGRWMVPIGTDGKVGHIPAGRQPKETIVVRGSAGGLKGIAFAAPDRDEQQQQEEEGQQKSSPPSGETVVWEFVPPAGQAIAEIATRSPHDPVASIGRVLADRRVSYKYLNPHSMVVAAIDADKNVLAIYLIDQVSGQVLSAATHPGVDPTRPVSCVIAENWFACAFFGAHQLSDGTDRSIRGYQITVSDLYESTEPNDRGPLGSAANFSSLEPIDDDNPAAGPSPPRPAVVSQTFVLSAPVSHLVVTSTRQGITARQVLAYLPETGGVAALPRQLLEPRRPVGRDPTAAEADAEGLIRYTAAIELDPRGLVSHEFEVLGIERMMTTPTGVESTSLVFACGAVDVFGTRVAPSRSFDILGREFDKISMIATVAGLMVGVAVLGPMVTRKQIDMRWQAQA